MINITGKIISLIFYPITVVIVIEVSGNHTSVRMIILTTTISTDISHIVEIAWSRKYSFLYCSLAERRNNAGDFFVWHTKNLLITKSLVLQAFHVLVG